jgi:hypothetical protein
MNNKIIATFVGKRFLDSGNDQSPDYYIYEFTDIVDSNGKKHTDKWIKETKLMKAVSFKKGQKYEIILSERGLSFNSSNLPFPKEVSWENERVYMKGGNSIIRVGKDKQEKNLSVPLNKIIGISNYDTAAFNKFDKGLMTEQLLLKMNAKGIYYSVHYTSLNDKNKYAGGGIGYSNSEKENKILIQKETQEEIDRDLEIIKRKYVTKTIEKYFTITTEIIPPKIKK